MGWNRELPLCSASGFERNASKGVRASSPSDGVGYEDSFPASPLEQP